MFQPPLYVCHTFFKRTVPFSYVSNQSAIWHLLEFSTSTNTLNFLTTFCLKNEMRGENENINKIRRQKCYSILLSFEFSYLSDETLCSLPFFYNISQKTLAGKMTDVDAV